MTNPIEEFLRAKVKDPAIERIETKLDELIQKVGEVLNGNPVSTQPEPKVKKPRTYIRVPLEEYSYCFRANSSVMAAGIPDHYGIHVANGMPVYLRWGPKGLSKNWFYHKVDGVTKPTVSLSPKKRITLGEYRKIFGWTKNLVSNVQ